MSKLIPFGGNLDVRHEIRAVKIDNMKIQGQLAAAETRIADAESTVARIKSEAESEVTRLQCLIVEAHQFMEFQGHISTDAEPWKQLRAEAVRIKLARSNPVAAHNPNGHSYPPLANLPILKV